MNVVGRAHNTDPYLAFPLAVNNFWCLGSRYTGQEECNLAGNLKERFPIVTEHLQNFCLPEWVPSFSLASFFRPDWSSPCVSFFLSFSVLYVKC